MTFCVVDCQDARTRSQILDYMRQSHNSKVKEWTGQSTQATISALQTDRQNKTGINGVLVWEPLISTFDKLQSMPLKIAMSAVSELLPDLVWKKDWQQHTIYTAGPQGEVDTYVVWCALDHLHGKAVICYNEELFSERAFKEAIHRHGFAMTAKKGWGKGKAKTLSTVGDLSRDETMDPQGSFMEQIGLGKGPNGKGVKNGYTVAMDRAMKSSLPFTLKVRPLQPTEFAKTYQEHLYRLLTRWS